MADDADVGACVAAAESPDENVWVWGAAWTPVDSAAAAADDVVADSPDVEPLESSASVCSAWVCSAWVCSV